MKQAVFAIPLVILAFSGCSGAALPPPASSSTVLPAASSTHSGGAVTKPATIKPATSTVKDKKADTDSGDVTQVELTRTADELRITVLTSGPLVLDTGNVGLYINLSSADGSVAKQAGVKWIDGAQEAYFVFDSGTSTQENLAGEATVSTSAVSVTFPADLLSDLGQVWMWQVVTTVDGEDADTVPEPGDDVLIPKRGALG